MKTKNDAVRIALIIAAAGSSARMGGTVKKELLPLPGTDATVISSATEAFLSALPVCTVLVTVPPRGGIEMTERMRNALFASPRITDIFSRKPDAPELIFTEGGESRQESVFHALKKLASGAETPDIVLIHDGARPFVTPDIVTGVYRGVLEHGAAVCAVPAVDTQKETDGTGKITAHLDRSRIAAVQTPQGFRFAQLLAAHEKAAADGGVYTDDTEIWDKYVSPVYIVPGSPENRKITYASDLPCKKEPFPTIRTGLGYDLHRLTEGRKLIIGGVVVPFSKGEAGHSDGDVLLHAITDALLGAAGLGDIGELFPPSDPEWKDADSAGLLKAAWDTVRRAGWRLGNMDCVVVLEQPKLLPYRTAIRASVAGILGTDTDSVFVKAKTGEKLPPIGTGEAIEAWVTCLLCKINGV